MARNDIRKTTVPSGYKDDRGNLNLISHPVIGVVKDNVDPTRNGRIRVYISTYSNTTPDNSDGWLTVSYMSPWFGVTSPKQDPQDTPDKTGFGNFTNNPHSYGMWASAPDIGSEVVCIFINGRPDQGYYIGGIPAAGLHHMVPAIGSSGNVIPNTGEANSYGDSSRLPVSEVNYGNTGIKNNPEINDLPKPIHSYQAQILFNQGLLRDYFRGSIGSTSQRETPSKVFGISTPGNPIYSGGYTSADIEQAATSGTDPSKFQVIGRTGGHSIVLDDGTLDGQDQLMRLRTAAGHQIMMNDSGQTIFIIHSNGQSWVELGKEGTVDVYTTNSFNVRSQGDINFHADRDVNIHAGRSLTMFSADNLSVETDKNYQLRSGQKIIQHSVDNTSVWTDGLLIMNAAGTASLVSKYETVLIKGQKLYLNSRAGSEATKLTNLTKKQHEDTVYSERVGWMNPGDKPLLSVTSRAPAHMPWVGNNTGVDVQVNQVAGAQVRSPSAAVQAAITSVNPLPNTPASIAAMSTVLGGVKALKTGTTALIDSTTMSAALSQQSATNSTLSKVDKIVQGIIPGRGGLTINQLETGGIIKPGSGQFILDKVRLGQSYQQAISTDLLTGKYGVKTSYDLLSRTDVQIRAFSESMKTSAADLISKNIISGKEAPTQITGLILGASNFGSKNVASLIRDPSTALSNFGSNAVTSILNNTGLGSAVNKVNNLYNNVNTVVQRGQALLNTVNSTSQNISRIGNMISSGNYASQISDKFLGGSSALASGISNIFGGSSGIGALGQLSSGVTGALGTISNGVTGVLGSITGSLGSLGGSLSGALGSLGALGPVAGLLGGLFGKSKRPQVENFGIDKLYAQLESTTRQAFLAAEASYDTLNPNVPNYLGGGISGLNGPASGSNSQGQSVLQSMVASAGNLAESENNLRQAQTLLKNTGSAEALSIVQTAETKLAQIKQKQAQLSGDTLTAGLGLGLAAVDTTTGHTESQIYAITGMKNTVTTPINNEVGNVLNIVRSATATLGEQVIASNAQIPIDTSSVQRNTKNLTK